MVSYKGEYFMKGVDNQPRPDIVFQIRMKEKKQRQKWSEHQKVAARVWLDEQRDRLQDFIDDL